MTLGCMVEKYLNDFHERLKGIVESDYVRQVYQNETFTARYFDDKGGYMEMAKVRMYIPPGAVNIPRQLVYMNLISDDPHVASNISSVVDVGPSGTKFNKMITLSYPHCAVNESKWNFTTLMFDYCNWKNVDSNKRVDTFVRNGRVIIKSLTI